MSLLICGMEMPKSRGEYDIRLYIDSDGTATVEGSYCRFEGEPFEAVPIPPHGDLIDRDALSKSLNKLCERVCQYSKAQRAVMCSSCPLGDAFAVVEDDAQAVIEAEVE